MSLHVAAFFVPRASLWSFPQFPGTVQYFKDLERLKSGTTQFLTPSLPHTFKVTHVTPNTIPNLTIPNHATDWFRALQSSPSDPLVRFEIQRNQTSFQTQPSRLEESGGFSEICMIGGSFNHLKQGLSALFWPINPQSNAVRTSNGLICRHSFSTIRPSVKNITPER